MARYRWLATRAALLGCVMLLAGFGDAPTSGRVQDEARSAGRAPESFPMADEDYFHDMDGGLHADRRTRSRAATCGSSGPAATTGSGTG